MKKLVILFFTSFAFLYSLEVQAQCEDTRMYGVVTPKGSPVITWVLCEDEPQIRQMKDEYYIGNWQNAILMGKFGSYYSTRTFNCHGYAWLISEGGPTRAMGWVDKEDDTENYDVGIYPEVYMTDGSYIQVSSYTHPAKVFWGNGCHSAITTEHQDTVISKWADGPLMKHYLSDCPWKNEYMYYGVEYYVKPSDIVINGPNVASYGGTEFTLSVSPVDMVVWSINSSDGYSISPDAADKRKVTLYKHGSPYDDVTLTATIADSIIITKNIHPCETIFDISNMAINANTSIITCYDIGIGNVDINATLTIESPGTIEIMNDVTIGSNGKLILETGGSGRVIFNDKFDLSTGSVEIR